MKQIRLQVAYAGVVLQRDASHKGLLDAKEPTVVLKQRTSPCPAFTHLQSLKAVAKSKTPHEEDSGVAWLHLAAGTAPPSPQGDPLQPLPSSLTTY